MDLNCLPCLSSLPAYSADFKLASLHTHIGGLPLPLNIYISLPLLLSICDLSIYIYHIYMETERGREHTHHCILYNIYHYKLYTSYIIYVHITHHYILYYIYYILLYINILLNLLVLFLWRSLTNIPPKLLTFHCKLSLIICTCTKFQVIR